MAKGALPAGAKNDAKMPSADDLANFVRLQGGVSFDSSLKLVSQLPPLPPEITQRYPSMVQWEKSLKEWHKSLLLALQGGAPATVSTKKTP